MPEEKKLTVKQKKFIDNYIANNGNGTQAAIDAGYSPRSADVIAVENLGKPSIISTLQDKNREILANNGLDLNWRAKMLERIAQQGIETNTLQASLNAIEIMNKIGGDYAPTQTENTNKNLNVQADLRKAAGYINKFKRDK